jgi:putative transposase
VLGDLTPLKFWPQAQAARPDVHTSGPGSVCEVEPKRLPETGNAVGVDVGTTWFCITSDREFTANPRHFQSTMETLRVAQRAVSRKKTKRSNRRKKAVQRVAKLHRKISRQRLDFHHKTALKLIRENDLIAHEDLNVSGMGHGSLARSIYDVGWSQFFSPYLQSGRCWTASGAPRPPLHLPGVFAVRAHL